MEKLINHLNNFGWNEIYITIGNDKRILGVDFKDGLDETEIEAICQQVIISLKSVYGDQKCNYYLQILRTFKSTTTIWILMHK